MAIRLSENFVIDVLAHFFVIDVLALNRYKLAEPTEDMFRLPVEGRWCAGSFRYGGEFVCFHKSIRPPAGRRSVKSRSIYTCLFQNTPVLLSCTLVFYTLPLLIEIFDFKVFLLSPVKVKSVPRDGRGSLHGD